MVREQYVSAEHQAHGVILGFSRFGLRRLCRIHVSKGTAVSGFIRPAAVPVSRFVPASAKTGIPERLVLTAGRCVCAFLPAASGPPGLPSSGLRLHRLVGMSGAVPHHITDHAGKRDPQHCRQRGSPSCPVHLSTSVTFLFV